MKLSQYKLLSLKDREAYLKDLIPKNSSVRTSKIKSGRMNPIPYINCLYSNYFFWTDRKKDLKIILKEESILNGELISWTDGVIDCMMTWTGYVSQIYDGELYMTPLMSDAKIEGTIENETFSFSGVDPVGKSPWPGFISLFERTI